MKKKLTKKKIGELCRDFNRISDNLLTAKFWNVSEAQINEWKKELALIKEELESSDKLHKVGGN